MGVVQRSNNALSSVGSPTEAVNQAGDVHAAMRCASFVVVGGSVQTLLRLGSEAAVQEQAAMPRCGKTAMGLMRLWAAMRGASFVVAGSFVPRLLRLGSEAAVQEQAAMP